MQNKTTTDPAAAPSAASSAAPSASTSGVPDGFQKVDDAAPEMQSGEALLVEAYAFIWVVLFGLVLLTWLRQRGLDVRMNELEASIARARNPRPPAKEAAAKRATPDPADGDDGAEKAD
jgi:hypothetical protein